MKGVSFRVVLRLFTMFEPSTSRVSLRKDEDIFLVGKVSEQIIGNKLPSKRQVLSVIFFNLRKLNKNLRESSTLALEEVLVFWKKASIPVKKKDRCIQQVQTLYNEWRNLQKGATRESENEVKKRQEFIGELDNLFDIAHNDALSTIKIEEDKTVFDGSARKRKAGMHDWCRQKICRDKQKTSRTSS